MIRWFKKHFVPHGGNDHQPHFLRGKNIRVFVLIVLVFELGVLVLPRVFSLHLSNSDFVTAVLPAVLTDLTNEKREKEELPVLQVSAVLNTIAEMKARDMAEKGYFAHTSPEGKNPWYWFALGGYAYESAGENLAVNFSDSRDVTRAWMNSPGHKANILKNTFTEIGTGVATGTYQGRETIFVAQVFGRPTVAPVVATAEGAVAYVPLNTPKTSGVTVPEVQGASDDKAEDRIVEDSVVTTPTDRNTVPTGSELVRTGAVSFKPTFIQRAFASPRHAASTVFLFFGSIVLLATMLKFFVRMDKKHPVLVTNGLIALVLIFGIYVANDYMAQSSMAASTSFVSFENDTFLVE